MGNEIEHSCRQSQINATEIAEIKRRMDSYEDTVCDIRDRLLGRPSWAVLAIITTLTSLSIGLLVVVIKHVI